MHNLINNTLGKINALSAQYRKLLAWNMYLNSHYTIESGMLNVVNMEENDENYGVQLFK